MSSSYRAFSFLTLASCKLCYESSMWFPSYVSDFCTLKTWQGWGMFLSKNQSCLPCLDKYLGGEGKFHTVAIPHFDGKLSCQVSLALEEKPKKYRSGINNPSWLQCHISHNVSDLLPQRPYSMVDFLLCSCFALFLFKHLFLTGNGQYLQKWHMILGASVSEFSTGITLRGTHFPEVGFFPLWATQISLRSVKKAWKVQGEETKEERNQTSEELDRHGG